MSTYVGGFVPLRYIDEILEAVALGNNEPLKGIKYPRHELLTGKSVLVKISNNEPQLIKSATLLADVVIASVTDVIIITFSLYSTVVSIVIRPDGSIEVGDVRDM